jgi:putative ABC transport system permease protein
MIIPKIAFRNLTRQKRRSILLASALSFGMFILVVVNGVTGGLVQSLQRNFADMISGHIFFLQIEKDPETGKYVSISRDDKELLEQFKASGLKFSSVARRTTAYGPIIFSGGSQNRSITGVNWADEATFADSLNIIAGDAHGMAGTDGILIADVLAENIGLVQKKALTYSETANLRIEVKKRWRAEGKSFDLDDEVKKETKRLEAEREAKKLEDAKKAIGETLVVKLNTIYGQENVIEFRVAGIFTTQMDYSAYVDRGVLDAAIEMPADSYNLCGIMLDDFSSLDAKTVLLNRALTDKYDLVPYDKIRGKAANTVVSDLKKEGFAGKKTIITNLNNELGSIVSVLTGVQAGCFGLFVVVLMVVMVGLVNTFRIIVYERTKEIGTMRAVGAQRRQIRNLFIVEALSLGVVGSIPGAILGAIVLNVIKLFRFDAFTELALFLDNGHINFTISPALLAGSVLIVLLFTLLAALMPASKAAKMEPAHALRSQF